MKRIDSMLWKLGGLVVLGVGVLGFALPQPAHAGGVHVSVGLGFPLPVVVAPPPVVVTPRPVIVRHPVVVQPQPTVVYQPPVVVEERYHDHSRCLPPGLAKKHHRHYRQHTYVHHEYGKHHGRYYNDRYGKYHGRYHNDD